MASKVPIASTREIIDKFYDQLAEKIDSNAILGELLERELLYQNQRKRIDRSYKRDGSIVANEKLLDCLPLNIENLISFATVLINNSTGEAARSLGEAIIAEIKQPEGKSI